MTVRRESSLRRTFSEAEAARPALALLEKHRLAGWAWVWRPLVKPEEAALADLDPCNAADLRLVAAAWYTIFPTYLKLMISFFLSFFLIFNICCVIFPEFLGKFF
uniref:Uncharacterized protein n=1 Tax=Opuntia streptacantha TaxID=393608 RepID=A0A7C8Z6U0_OPUST